MVTEVRTNANRVHQVTTRLTRIDTEILAKAKDDCLFMHCMPAHPEEEVTQKVLDSPHAVLLDQAENRLHMQKAILRSLFSLRNKTKAS